MLVIVAPGQGAQTPGFLAPWLELPGVADRLGAWSELAGCDLIRYGTTATAEEITDTAVAQPLLVAAGLAAAEAAFGDLAAAAGHAHATAGHSVGELTAGVLAGVLSAADAMRLTGIRGRAMAEAAAVTPTGMTAVLGGDSTDEVLASIAAHGLTPANVNGAGQIVAAGTLEQLAAFAEEPPPGAKLRALRVAGAFHTVHMGPAVAALREAAAGVEVADPVIPLLSNADGAAVTTGADWLERIVNQVSAPVRWDACMTTLAGLEVTAMVELLPGGTLVGLARRALPGVARLGLKRPDQLDELRALVDEHGRADGNHGPGADSHFPEWRLLVAPLAGTFRAGSPTEPGTEVSAGTELGRVEARGGKQPVSPSYPGTIIEWLAEDGDPVSAGQPLARLQPQAPERTM